MLPRLLALAFVALLALGAWTVRGPDGAPTDRSVAPDRLFVAGAGPWQGATLLTPAGDLGAAAGSAADWLEVEGAGDRRAGHAGVLGALGPSLDQVRATLRFVATVAAVDGATGANRLQDPAFIAEHFDYYAWRASAWSGEDDRLRLTRYLVYQVQGSMVKNAVYTTALYAVPDDEVGLSEAEAEAKKSSLLRYKYSRPQVLGGVFEPGGASAGRAWPLVYLTRADALQAQLQGTVEVKLSSGSSQLFNVHRPNGFAYEKGATLEKQPRYWYFRPVDGLYGYGAEDRVKLTPGASVAGDVYNLGVGKLIALSWPSGAGRAVRLVVLGDTGGAFQPNLGQLDYLAGSFPSKDAFLAATRDMPDRVDAGILVLKQPAPDAP